jgi:uncharacterized protein with HEPN domain
MKKDRLYLIHIRECLERIAHYTTDGREKFLATNLIQDAVLRNLQTLSESSKRHSSTLKALHPDIEWDRMVGFRNVLVHEYLGINLGRVWEIIEQEVPPLRTKVGSLLRAPKKPDSGGRSSTPRRRTMKGRPQLKRTKKRKE